MSADSSALTDYLKQSMPLVSIIVPSFNKASYLPETIESIASQQYAALEVLIVDDGSTDSTEEVVRQLKNQYPALGIAYFKKPNGGVSHTRNYAIERAKGRLILNLDGDDLLKPGFLVEATRLMQEQNANVVTSNVELFGAEIGEWKPVAYDDYVNRYTNVIPTLVLFDKEIWERVGGYSPAFPFNEDWDFFLAAQQRGITLKVAKPSQIFFRYRMTPEGLAAQYIKESRLFSVSLMVTNHSFLYPVEEVIKAHEILSEMPIHWFERIKKQNEMYPKEWVSHFWTGLVEQKRGNVQNAAQRFNDALHLSDWKEWQPMYCLSKMIDPSGSPDHLLQLLHQVRIFRPDMKKYVDQPCEELLVKKKVAKNSNGTSN